ncbi:MAG: PEP-CTERM sorting domain-containing protein [Phycisphaerales bacterium]|nr:PEP-CTERM sorting domain-containing protein [Phycisphaerales bacterium]
MTTIRMCAAIAAAGLTCALASAATVTATFNSVTPGSDGQFSLDGGANWGNTGPAGLFNWTRTGGDHTGLQGDFLAFCTELTEHIGYNNSYNYTVDTIENAPTALGGMGAAKADQLRELFGRYYTPAFASTLGSTQAAAMQMCVWEIAHEQTPGLDITAGSAMFVNNDGAAMALANAYLASIDGTGPRDYTIYSLLADGVQDMIVPGPGTIVLAGAGLLAIARRRR